MSETGIRMTAGKKLGAYEIVEHVGSGGMGDVYRARDPRFKRDVAVKLLPSDFAKDPDRLQRFEQEAQAAGMLNHPNILSVFDTGINDGSPYLVSEFLEGETIREKLSAGPFSQRKAVDYALQLARGLSAAHEKGIVHRDLKPENLIVTKDGRLKILDFGLSKLSLADSAEGAVTQLPTSPGTQPGMVLGTIGYMSPEQVRGKVADHRSDIFAFGAILYEMITGKRAFRGDTPADTLSVILQKEPPEISETNRNISPALSRIVQHCLEKDPEQRFHSASDIAFNLESLSGFSEQSGVAAVSRVRAKVPVYIWKTLTVSALLALAVIGFLYYGKLRESHPLLSVSLDIPPGYALGPNQGGGIAISPDGKTVAFCALSIKDRKWRLWLRRLDQSSPVLIKGTEGASAPFWSPDSEYVAFFTDGKLQKMKRSGGLLQPICEAPAGRGGSWSANGTIVFSPQPYGPLYKVNATGGTPSPLTKVEKADASHRWPFFLPDGNHFVFTGQDPYGIFVASLDAPQPKPLNSESSNAIFMKPDLLLFAREGTLIAQPFSVNKLAFTGEGEPLLQERINHDPDRSFASFSASTDHSLVYQPEVLTIARPTVFDRLGKQVSTFGPAASYNAAPIFSPDGKQLALMLSDPDTGKWDVWKYEFAGDRLSRITVGENPNGIAIWSADQSRILFTLGSKVYQRQANVASPEELLFESSQYVVVTTCSPDGKSALMNYQNPRGDWDLRVLSLSGDKKTRKFIETRNNEAGSQFSPDGKWVAFVSDSTGQLEIYVAPFSDPGRVLQISTDGGQNVQWTSSGKELLYINKEKVMSVDVKDPGNFGNPKVLFERPQASLNQPVAIEPDGQRFVLLMPTGDQNTENIHFISDWTQLLKK